MPLEQNPLSGEFFLRLPEPHSNIILTPPRPGEPDEEDINIIVPALNDPRVYSFLESTPVPYTRDHARDYMRRTDEDCRRIILASLMTDLRGPEDQDQDRDRDQKSFADGCPFRSIRKIVPVEKDDDDDDDDDADGKGLFRDTLIGDIAMQRHPFYDIPHDRVEEKLQAREKNDALPPGHPELVWTVGFWLLPTHHNSGIMTACLQTIIHEWAIPRMNVTVIMGSVFLGNEGSRAVFRKNGFEFVGLVEKGSAELPPQKGGPGRKDLWVLRWVRS